MGIAATDLPKAFFSIFVTAVSIVPRMPFDQPLSIGGDLSKPFRQLLLGLTLLRLSRHAVTLSRTGQRIFLAIEGEALTLLSLLAPYLLRVFLANKINIPGAKGAGQGLMPWLYACGGLTFLGAILRIITGEQDFWILKKLSDALSFIPVYRTLKYYNMVTTGQAPYPGRGPIISQIVMLGEYYSLSAHTIDIITKIIHYLDLIKDSDAFIKSTIVKGLYMDNFYASFSRILCHAVLLNAIDENYHLCPTPDADHGVESVPVHNPVHPTPSVVIDDEKMQLTKV